MNSTFDVKEMYANFSENPQWLLFPLLSNQIGVSQCLFIGSLKS